MAEIIDIQEVLAVISDLSEGIEFSIAFVRAHQGSGGPKGSIKFVEHCRRGFRRRKVSTTAKKGKSSGKVPVHKLNGTLPMVEVVTDRMISVRISHIIEFNKFKVKH